MNKHKQKTCNCAAYAFPHRLDSGKCRELYNEECEREAKEFQYYETRGLHTHYQRAMHDAGHSERDF